MRLLLALLFTPIALVAQATDSLMGPGVSLGLARYRAATVREVRYDLSLDVTAPDSGVGRVIVSFARIAPNAEARAIGGKTAGDVYLDFRGRRLSGITVNGAPVALTAFNGAHVRVPASTLRPLGSAVRDSVVLTFATDIAPSGASIIKSHDPTDNSDYLYTLLVPADANQLFPAFDQPDLKARVTLHLTAPRAWRTLANGAESRADTAATAITHHFNETKPLSTYLIAFAAGPWEVASSTVNGRTVRVFARRSRFKEADTDTLLALNQRAVAWMEDYFARPYPFEKFDFLLAPAFPFGGMEHPGAVFYNENSFIFRDRPTLARRIGRFSTILHEVAHQWFGDLVTMRWFDDLWLKEGFATYMAAKAQFALDSTGGAWKTFYQGNKPAAYAVDQTTGTNSLWQRLGNLDQAKSNYGAIVYNKAPSVLKQLNYLVGEPGFQRGVRDFLTTHAYANATWQDLLRAIGTASGTPLVAFGQNFMLRPGMPVVEQRLTIRDGRIARLRLVQRPAQALSGTAPWPMRTQVLLAYGADRPSVTIPVTMTGVTTEVLAARGQPAPRFVFANAQDYGYFLTLLDSASTANLEAGAIGDVADPFLRTMLWGALWDQVRDARFDPARFARLALREIPRERDEQLLPNLLGRLSRTVTTYVGANARAALQPDVERILWSGASDATRPFGIRRAYLDAFIGVAASTEGIARLTALWSADSVAGDVMRDPTRWTIVDRLTVLDDPAAPRLLAAQVARDTTPDGRRRAFVAGAARKSADVKREYFTRYFGDTSLNEDWASGSLGAFNASEHATLTLPYLRPALDSLPFIQQHRRIFFLGSWLSAFIGGQRNAEALAIVQRYLAEHPTLPLDLKQKVLQTADELDRTVRIRQRWP
jgi:aminopeptidase N